MKCSLRLPAGRDVPRRPAWDANRSNQLFTLELLQEQPPSPGGAATRVAGRYWSRDPGTLPWLGRECWHQADPGLMPLIVVTPPMPQRVVHLCLPLKQADRRSDSC